MFHLIVDVETTGFPRRDATLDEQPRITEFCGIICNDLGKEVQAVSFLCNPGIRIPNIVSEKTGIADSMVKDALPFREHSDKVSAMLRVSDVLVAHNLKFDMKMLGYEFERCGMEFPVPKNQICTMEEAKPLFGNKRPKLIDLHKFFFQEEFESHRAESDARAAARCYFEIFDLEDFEDFAELPYNSYSKDDHPDDAAAVEAGGLRISIET